MYRIENCKISLSLFKCATNPLGKKKIKIQNSSQIPRI